MTRHGIPDQPNQGVLFSAPVVYEQPSFEELIPSFSGYVSQEYKDKRFNVVEPCKHVSLQAREVTFCYIHLDCPASSKDASDEMKRKGLRPALYEELLGFAKKYPEEQLKHPISALGSETSIRGSRRVACLRRGPGWGTTTLSMYWVDREWSSSQRFLAVRE